MTFNTYSDKNIPRRGTARKIYNVLKTHGFCVIDLHYNPNNWGQNPWGGWGTWATTVLKDSYKTEHWCGWDDEMGVYLQECQLPFGIMWLDSESELDK